MREFSIATPDGTLVLRDGEPSTSAPYEAWEYVAELATPCVSAHVEVYDHVPQRLQEFFASLAHDWRGWSGERHYESLEPMLKISAKHDGKGLVVLTVVLRAGAAENFDWSVSHRLHVELGQLARIAEDAGRFTNVEARVVV